MSLCKKQKTTTDDLNYPKAYLQFDGQINYHRTVDSIDSVLKPILKEIDSESDLLDNKIIVGFDCEWDSRPKPSKVCLIQMCIDSNECHLFHISAMNYKIPESLQSLISHKRCLKVGLNIENDVWKLQRDYDLPLDDVLIGDNKSIVDLSVLANTLLGTTAKWSLSRLSEYILNKTICKRLQQSKWSRNPLSLEQQRYAAIDAFASYELYYEIKTNAMPFGYN